MLRHLSTIALVATLIILVDTDVAQAQRGRGGGGAEAAADEVAAAHERVAAADERWRRHGASIHADEPCSDGRK